MTNASYTPTSLEVLCRYQQWAGGSSSDESRKIEFSRWLEGVKAAVWDEGFDAGERDVMQHGADNFDLAPTPNPYKSIKHADIVPLRTTSVNLRDLTDPAVVERMKEEARADALASLVRTDKVRDREVR